MTTDFGGYLEELREKSRLRTIPQQSGELIDLVSNDYLGLGARSNEFKEEFEERFGDAAFSSSASRLLSREQKYHRLLEEKLEELYENKSVLFNSGYHANVGTLSALGTKDTLFLSDELMHASAIDGMMLAKGYGKATVIRFPHKDIGALRALLAANAASFKRVVIVTESIFSMDGDFSPMTELVELKKEFPGTLLYLDEAHAFGVRGEKGLGLAEELRLIDQVDILVGTFGKAAASTGAFIVANADIRDYILNRARSFIFSTALPPVNAAWTLLMVEKILGMHEERERLKQLSVEFRKLLDKSSELKTENISDSQIVPYLCGSAEKAIEIASKVREAGYDVLPIRYPTVAEGAERIRFSLNASLTLFQLLPLRKVLEDL